MKGLVLKNLVNVFSPSIEQLVDKMHISVMEMKGLQYISVIVV